MSGREWRRMAVAMAVTMILAGMEHPGLWGLLVLGGTCLLLAWADVELARHEAKRATR